MAVWGLDEGGELDANVLFLSARDNANTSPALEGPKVDPDET